MNKIAPPDFLEREKILTLLDQNLLVEAGAGSGKTSSLVGRMLAQVLAGNYRAKEIAAVTFTRKAAAELRARFQNKLEEEYRKATDADTKFRLEQALTDLNQCFLGTIHSFCARLLKERPIEAGLDPQFKELDDVQNRLLQEQAWESYLDQVKRENPGLIYKLNTLGVSPLELKSSFLKFSAYSDVEKVYQQFPKPDLQTPLATVVAVVNRAKNSIPVVEPPKGYDSLQGTILKALRQIRYFDLKKDFNLVKILANFDKEPKVTQNRWNSGAEAKLFRDEFWNLREAVVGPVLAQWREYCHPYLMEFVLPAVEHFEKMRYSLSLLNYDDLLAKAAQMLDNYPEVRLYFQNKYKCLLIDEFQDTDPIQAQLMFYLTGQDVSEKEWQKLVPKPGSLFVVGDPKQSIYRFRRADMDIYNLVKKLIVTQGGEVVKLTANFRSLQALGDWFNPVFTGLLPSEGNAYQAEFSNLHTMLPNKNGSAMGVQVIDIPASEDKKENSKEKIVERDADQIARYIKAALDGDLTLARSPEEMELGISDQPRPKDFLIITRYKDMMHTYARALEKYEIPAAMAGGSSLKEVHEIQELHKLLRCLKDPDNQVKLIAVLRGMFFGLSDNQLYQFKLAGGCFNIFAPIPDSLEFEIAQVFSGVFDKLKLYYNWTRELSAVVALEKIIEDVGLIPYSLCVGSGLGRCSYIYQMLEILRKAEANGAVGFNLLVEQFGAYLESDVEEELNLVAEDRDVVRIMNLHKSKGLEAPVVILAHPCKRIPPKVDQHIKRNGPNPQGYFVFTREKGYSSEIIGQPPQWEDCIAEEIKFLEAEETRLLYVAATRAKNLLVMSRNPKDPEMKKNPWAPLLQEIEGDFGIQVPEITPIQNPANDQNNTVKTSLQIPENFDNWGADLATPGISVGTPTGLKAGAALEQVKRLEGGGMAWGTAVHKVFEVAVKGTLDMSTEIEVALRENGLDNYRKQEILQLIKNFSRSKIWSELQLAPEKLTETPFSIRLEATDPIYELLSREDGLPIVLSGVIDLAFKGDEGWEIVDYKTDRVVDEEDLQILIKVYSVQVLLYCRIWERLTREAVRRGRLYFTNWHGEKEVVVYDGEGPTY